MQTSLTELLGCRYPIIQTAMGWVADPALVSATCEAGGFGFLAGAVMTPAEVEAGIEQIKAKTDQPFGVNFHMYTPGASEIVDICIRHGVRAVSYSRSPAPDMIARLKAAGVVCIPTVGALQHAVKAVAMGADAVVVQGCEGGGHTGKVASSILLPQVISALDVPVVAAGGYKDGRGLVAALACGAAGIAMGTRFLMTRESPVPQLTKARYVGARAEEIIVSTKLDGLPQRMINNECLQTLEHKSKVGMLLLAIRNGLAFTKLTGASLFSMLTSAWRMKQSNRLGFGQTLMAANAPMLIQEAMVKGHPQNGILPSGQVAGVIDDLPAVADLINDIMCEAEDTIERLAALQKN
ncbi:MAG: nitronate monooxygenase [Gammaproteobacteria bacterium]|uniref:NAD(P)H-dependent flavin oxidoreductase n=1 Tax=Pseudomaricurvus alcaniphilus TaxID=1166482 RepID=UPI00140C40DB|nr:nitronate monooxygenase [Pseudomaricurvus alcaniphilus]MBR9911105.1 nitronate monooxygenase [Gammaproteobacteria bacterium]NHN36391.1 nitronate monooxygenase [Pseudomaricurvus alcaniphilus]